MTHSLFSLLAESSSMLFFAYDPAAAQFTYINPAFRTFFSLASDMPKLETFMAMVHPDDRNYIIERFEDIATDSVDGIECRFTQNGTNGALRINAYLITEQDKRLIVGHAEDISVYKQYINTILKHNAKKNAILNIVTHDLAGPLGTISNLSEILKKETIANETTKALVHLDMIKKISKSCTKLIRDFLNQEFLASADVPIVKRRVDLAGSIREFTKQYLVIQEELSIDFCYRTDEDIMYMDVDEDKFIQVLNNLLSNSMKFTAAGGRISISLEEREHDVLISVSDTGIGIPEKYHGVLFEKFTPARRNGLRGEETIGLGMSIIKSIVEWHNGRIWFKSIENKGTTFYIELPKK